MPVIAFVGAGSTVFTRNLVGDLLAYEDLAGTLEFRLHDIDPNRLRTSEIVVRRLVEGAGVDVPITATLERARAVEGADHVITMFQIGGYEPSTRIDFEIPERYGLEQTIADTLGIGGIMRGLRTAPVLASVAADMEALCPEALLLNYANPMAINMWHLAQESDVAAVGLCHSVPLTVAELAGDLGVEPGEIDFLAAGINHMAFFLRLERAGEDLYPQLKALHTSPTHAPLRGRRKMVDAVRYEMMRRLGYFVTESSEHFAEYTPYFIKGARPDLVEEYGVPLREYMRRCEDQIREWAELRARLEDPAEALEVPRTDEYAPRIIHSIETGTEREVYVNVQNCGLIDNLPTGCVVEVPARVSSAGVEPVAVGALPPQLAALMRTNIGVQELTVEALRSGRREHVHHAAMLDPRTAAELDLGQIWSLVDELLEAHRDHLPASLDDLASS